MKKAKQLTPALKRKIAAIDDVEYKQEHFYPIQKQKHKYYLCECGTELRVTSTIKTDWYGTLEYMKCSCCQDFITGKASIMVAQNGNFLGLAAR